MRKLMVVVMCRLVVAGRRRTDANNLEGGRWVEVFPSRYLLPANDAIQRQPIP